jgi:hypothetical protein
MVLVELLLVVLAAAVLIVLLVLPVIHPQPHLRKVTMVVTEKNLGALLGQAVAVAAQVQ